MSDFDRIRELHAPLVWGVVARILKNRDDAQDCFQEVFAEAIARSRKTTVRDWGAWLRWLATRRAIDALRRRRRRAVPGDMEAVCDTSSGAEQQATFSELVDRIRNELTYLPDAQAEAFWLVCVENRSYDEVAGHMGIQRNAVGVLVHRARQHLRSRLTVFNEPIRE